MRGWVRGIGELLRHEHMRILLRHALGDGAAFRDGVADVARIVHEDHFGTVVAHELAPLFAHAVRHHDHGLVASHGTHQRETDALIAACRLHDGRVRREQTARFGVADHVVGGTRLDGAAHVEGFELHQHLSHVWRDHAVEPHQRGVAHCVQYRVADHLVIPWFCRARIIPCSGAGRMRHFVALRLGCPAVAGRMSEQVGVGAGAGEGQREDIAVDSVN